MKLLMVLAAFAGVAEAQSPTSPITGVWKIAGASTPKQVIESQSWNLHFHRKVFQQALGPE
jgi:hypothetical protein